MLINRTVTRERTRTSIFLHGRFFSAKIEPFLQTTGDKQLIFVPFVVANGLKDLGGLLKTLLSITKYEKYFIYSEYFM